MDDFRIGVMLPTSQAQWDDPREVVRLGVEAERLGLDSLWVNDSLLSPRLEALSVLAALAPATERVTLGTAALLPVLRRPVQTAQTLASVDLLSGGRLVVAVGAGFPGRFGRPLHELSAVPWEGRFARLDDTVALWRALWTAAGPSSYAGPVHTFPALPAGLLPARVGGPPVWLGGATPAALARVGARYDGWLPYPPDPAAYRAGLATARAAAVSAGREAAAVTPALFVTVLVTDAADGGAAALAAYSQANYGLPLAELAQIQALVAGPASRVAERLGEYVAAGARHLVCRLATPDLPSFRAHLPQLAALSDRFRAVAN